MTTAGNGPPIVLIPGIQGRWEWMRPTIDALAARHRVLSFSLGEVQGPGLFERWTELIDSLLDRVGASSAAVVGVSFGGLVAAHYAASRPHRVSRLVLVSAPSPSWRLDARLSSYVRRPRLSLPLFVGRAALRLAPEVFAALPTFTSRLAFASEHLARVIRFPVSPRRMAEWVEEWEGTDLVRVCRQVSAPTLVITGEAALDRVVPVSSSLEYLSLIPGARAATLASTGHMGLLLRPREFAALVADFLERDVLAGR